MTASNSPSCTLLHVDYVETARIDPRDWGRLLALLPADEQARAARFRFARDREVYIAGHALLRDMLCRHAGGVPRDWRFTIGPHGKPAPVLPEGAPDIRVNLSHTRGVAVVALAVGADVGVDVEWMSRENELARIAARFFAPAECRQLDAAPADSRRELFFAFWTLKEAYIKATGHGLSMPLADFAFDLAASPSVSFAAHIEDDPRAWCFWHQHLLGTHALAIALRCPPEMAPMFRVSSAPLDHLTGR